MGMFSAMPCSLLLGDFLPLSCMPSSPASLIDHFSLDGLGLLGFSVLNRDYPGVRHVVYFSHLSGGGELDLRPDVHRIDPRIDFETREV